jgi:hypothetical protein
MILRLNLGPPGRKECMEGVNTERGRKIKRLFSEVVNFSYVE